MDLKLKSTAHTRMKTKIWNIFSEAMMSYIENDVDIEKHDSVNTATANEIAHSEMS